jgi:hypothetical protein
MMYRKQILLVTLLCTCGCSNMNNTQADALGGGVLGAAVGAIAGGPRHALAGAAIGGAAGAGTGALIGHSQDQAEKRAADARAAALANPPLSLEQIAQMAQNHTADSLIINQIRVSGSVYQLTPDQITWLKAQGVSDPVVAEMQYTAVRYGYAAPRRVYVVEQPPPPPPPSVGVGLVIAR